MNSREIIAALERAGWVKIAQKGSHVQFKHPERLGRAPFRTHHAISRLARCAALSGNPASN
jgi:predicted RNA binding protein YcfA (HicA-like mRNA interferase family)